MEAERGCDRIIKILNNKFCIAQMKQTDGTFYKLRGREIHTIFGLDNGICYSYGQHESNLKDLKAWIDRHVFSLPNTERQMVGYTYGYRMKTADNRKYKKRYRKLLRALNQ
jgi:hypothetical protein